MNNTGNYCITANGVEFEPRRDSSSIYYGGVEISICESFIAQNSNSSSVLRFDKYQQPIIIVKWAAGSEVALPICYTSTVGHELTWRPSEAFPNVYYFTVNGTSRVGYDEHIHTRFDKKSFTIPSFDGELLDYDNPAAPRGNFTVFIAADNEAKIGLHPIIVITETPVSKFEVEYTSGGGTGIEFDVVDSS